MKIKLFSLLTAALVLVSLSVQAGTEPSSCKSIRQKYPTKQQWQAASNIDCTKLPSAEQMKCRNIVRDIFIDGQYCKW